MTPGPINPPDHGDEIDIARLLDLHRPERYKATDKTWMDPVVGMVAETISAEKARTIAAERIVYRKEGDATKAANKLLRSYGESGQWPIDWMDLADAPIATTDDDDRVQLKAATAADLRAFAVRERRAAAADFSARNAACTGAEALADMIDDAEVESVGRWAKSLDAA